MSLLQLLNDLCGGNVPKETLVLLLYEHKCAGAKIRCCDEFRCESCHVEHVNKIHPKLVHTAERFHCTDRLIFGQESHTSKPKNQRTKAGNKKARKLKGGLDELFQEMSDEQALQVLDSLVERMKKL